MPNLRAEALKLFSEFLDAHPETAAATTAAAGPEQQPAAEPQPPERFYEIIRGLLPLVHGLTDGARAEYEAAITQHQAEHTALAATLGPAVPEKTEGETA